MVALKSVSLRTSVTLRAALLGFLSGTQLLKVQEPNNCRENSRLLYCFLNTHFVDGNLETGKVACQISSF